MYLRLFHSNLNLSFRQNSIFPTPMLMKTLRFPSVCLGPHSFKSAPETAPSAALYGLLGPGAGVNRVVGRNKKQLTLRNISDLNEI